MPQMNCNRNQHWERRARGNMFKQATPRWPGIRCIFWGTSNIWRAKMFSVPITLLIPTIWHYRKQNFVSFLKICLGLICAINFLMIFVTPHLAPSFFEKVQIGRSGGPEFWVIWKVRDPQDLIFKTPNRGPESPLPSQKSERPSGPHF